MMRGTIIAESIPTLSAKVNNITPLSPPLILWGVRVRLPALFFLAAFILSASTTFAFKLPDTGQTLCYDSAGKVINCAGTGQDGEYNMHPMSYTDNGNGTVTDNNTGLMWQQQDDGNLHNWYQASGVYDATFNPTSQNVCGSLSLGGHTDWRLPSKKELVTIVDYSIPNPGPTINSIFTNTQQFEYWSSTNITFHAQILDFQHGIVFYDIPDYEHYVRCVRGGQYTAQSFTDNGDGTVTDNKTGLVWQQGEPGNRTWQDALTYCKGLILGGQTDWRLPNVKELESITDDNRYDPAIDTTYFPGAVASIYYSIYWTSTSVVSLN